jgi:hypothetical protein
VAGTIYYNKDTIINWGYRKVQNSLDAFVEPQKDLEAVYDLLADKPHALNVVKNMRKSETETLKLLNIESIAKRFVKIEGEQQAKSVISMNKDQRLAYVKAIELSILEDLKTAVKGRLGKVNAKEIIEKGNVGTLTFIDGLTDVQFGTFNNLFNNLSRDKMVQTLNEHFKDGPKVISEQEFTDIMKILNPSLAVKPS